MDLLSRAEIEGTDEGYHFIPNDVLARLHPQVLLDASAAYAELVANHPNYEIGIVQDAEKGIKVYWKRVA